MEINAMINRINALAKKKKNLRSDAGGAGRAKGAVQGISGEHPQPVEGTAR